MKFKKKIKLSILNLPRSTKKMIALFCDFGLCLVSIVLAYYLRLDQLVPLKGSALIAATISVIIALPVFWFTGSYRTIFRYSELSIVFSALLSTFVYGLIYASIFTLYGIENVPRSIGILQPMLLFFGIILSRLMVKYLLGSSNQKKNRSYKTILIYGTGDVGRNLAVSLENSFEYKVVGFLDDDEKIQGQILFGKNIYNPYQLDELIQTEDIDLILLALPSINRFKRNQILEKIRHYKLKILTLPSYNDIIDGKVTVSDIKELDVNDILDREIVPPEKNLLYKNIKSQTILVTGAGGSIGSELCRQIVTGKPKALILCELNEYVLYKIFEELKIINKDLKIIPLLVNVQDENKIKEILKTFKIDTIYHAAAYKHVPLVESNICEGVLNNVFGTYSIAKAAIEQKALNFVLISSDKAVRPTNIMGATKRLSELCVQALYHEYKNNKTNMSIVRFGNVLESSGSVIPKFKQQIKLGGPVTLTHENVTRYFMTIIEAAQLVIQAGAMSNNCDVFILDMGKSVKIKDLIYRIIQLSGLNVKDEEHPDGDIEIKIIGLRTGEKLYEELLLGDNPQPTNHKKIQKAQDPFIPLPKLEKDLASLKLHLINNRAKQAKIMLENILSSYHSEYKIVDYIYKEQEDINNNYSKIEKYKDINAKTEN
jgi:FlaA1/EpsC-like NDP-sugar epimerase